MNKTPQTFTDQLTAIEQLLPPSSLATLRPPSSEASILQIEQLLGTALSLVLRQLLLWHDGQEWNAELRESDNHRLLAASEVIDALRFFLDPEEEFCEPWERYWVPFMTNDSGITSLSMLRHQVLESSSTIGTTGKTEASPINPSLTGLWA